MRKSKLVVMLFVLALIVSQFANAEVYKSQNFARIFISGIRLAGGDNEISTVRRMVGGSYGYYFTPLFGGIITGGSGYVIPRQDISGKKWTDDLFTGADSTSKTYLYPISLELRINAVGKSQLIPYITLGGGMLYSQVRDVSQDDNNGIFGMAGDEIPGYEMNSNFFGKLGAGFEMWFFGPVSLDVSANYYMLSGQDKDMFAYNPNGNGVIEDKPNSMLEGRIAFSVSFGGKKDSDGDGIYDNKDDCPNDPEDFDGFQDEDGCPDVDNDNDGILDVNDQCPNDPEDIDGFQDEDGCPDPDNDNDGILDVNDKCPNDPEDIDGFQDEDGCPDPDNDQDGILDVNDKCPNEAEDIDGFQDEDGCPDPDNDQDGILDVNDACPDDPETVNGYEDEDGCPDTVPEVIFKKEAPIVLEGVNFEFNSADLTAGAKEVLMKVVRTLKEYPDMTLLIKGHTDSKGSDAYNLKLSQRRAASVRQFLIENGIDSSRLEAIGYGETQPIASNDTSEGRAKNRRIEFYRVK